MFETNNAAGPAMIEAEHVQCAGRILDMLERGFEYGIILYLNIFCGHSFLYCKEKLRQEM